jgi:hypothetical protein
MAVDDTYIYNVKIASSTEDNAFITRTHRTSGSTVYMTNASTGGYFFTNLYHANDMEIVTVDGVQNLLVATGEAGSDSLVRFEINGTTLTQVGSYTAIYDDGSQTGISSAKVMGVHGTVLDLIVKKNKYLYYATLDVSKSSGEFTIVHAFTLDVENVSIDGTVYDLTEWLHQGFEYIDHKIFVPITGYPDMSVSSIVVYDIQGASGTIRNDPSLSFYIQSTTYSEKFEFESCGICPADGRLYFNTNQATSSDGDYDSIHVFDDYVYDPSGGAAQPGVYRWETRGGSLQSVTSGGAAYNGLAMSQGSISGTDYTDGRFSLHEGVVLKHDQPWILEWKSSGIWTNGGLLMSSYSKSKFEGNRYIFRRKESSLIALGEFSGNTYYNYGLELSDYGIDGTAEHVYRMTNKLSTDGSNMVWLSVDGRELGALNNYYIAGSSQGTTSDWISGKDFTFSYIGTDLHPIDDCSLEYIQIWGRGLLDQKDGADTYRWESGMENISAPGLTANTASALGGSVSGSTHTGSRYALEKNVVLLHDRPWSLEWRSEGDWSGGALLLAAAGQSKTVDAPFLFRNRDSTMIALGYYDGSRFNNYGVALEEKGIDGTVAHTYRLTNRIGADGSNMVYLFVDGVELGAMTEYFNGGSAQGTTGNWVAGQDFTFSYIGTAQHDINATVEYLQIWENGIPAEHAPNSYRWETVNDTLASVTDGFAYNHSSQLAGIISSGTYSGTYFQLDKPVVLVHDRPWKVQWQSEGSFKDSASGTLLLASASDGYQINATYLYRRNDSHIIAFGERYDGYHQNYGIKLSDHGIDGTAAHTYLLENRVNTDGSNMVYLFVDGVELGAMNRHYKGGTDQNTTSDWVSGKDFVFNYFGNPDFTVGNCSIGYLQVEEGCSHSFTGWSGSDATCTSAGVQTRSCTLCGAVETKTVAATGHSYESKVTAPTCSGGGYTTHTCTVCGDTYQDSPTAALAHSYKATVIEPTCITDGYTTYICRVCGHSYQDDHTDATGHSYKATVIDPTCVTGGYTTYHCKVCGDTYQSDNTSPSGHRYTGTVTAPTCIDQGYTTYICQDCGSSYTGDFTDATGHNYIPNVIAPTCTTGGYTIYTCSGCGHSYKDLITEPTGHSYANGTCTVCGEADPDYVKPVVTPTLTLKSPTLEFKDMITVNAMFTAENIEDVVEMGMITYTEKVDEWSVETAAHVIPGTSYDATTGRYIAHSQGINAKYLGDTVYLACYAKLTDGSYVYTKLAPYSPVQYATNQLKNSSDTKLKQLVASMLNYGAEAQLFFGHNTDALANATLTDEQKALPEAYRADMVASVPAVDAAKQGIFANNKSFSKRYPAISFEGAFCINYFFKPNYAPVGDITLYYWNEAEFEANQVLTKENASGTLTLALEDSGEYRGDIEGIAAKNLSEAVYVAAVYSDGTTEWTSGVLGYSIGAYCASQISKAADVAALAEATAVYGYHAKAYFG